MSALIPPVLFGLGIMIAISGGAKVPEKVGEWPDSVPIFIVGAVIATIGLLMWRAAKAEERKALASGQGADGGDPFAFLEDAQAPLATLAEDIGSLAPEVICERVDALLLQYILPLAEVRQRVIDRVGMDKGAEILVTVAYGERMLNRTWSAAGDGHLPEARSVYPDAVSALAEAQSQATAALGV
jgi:hypothetical protein